MAQKGQSISNKRTGETITWLETSKDTNGRKLVFRFQVAPNGKLPVVHLHPMQDETFTIERGNFTIRTKEKTLTIGAGESYTIRKGLAHQWWNDSQDEAAEMIVTFEPALNTETFLEQFFGLNNDGKTHPDGSPKFLQIMAMVNEYQLYIDGPPLAIQKIMGKIIGGFARLLGYRSYYAKYSETPADQRIRTSSVASLS